MLVEVVERSMGPGMSTERQNVELESGQVACGTLFLVTNVSTRTGR
jgi:hypothetical protein